MWGLRCFVLPVLSRFISHKILLILRLIRCDKEPGHITKPTEERAFCLLTGDFFAMLLAIQSLVSFLSHQI